MHRFTTWFADGGGQPGKGLLEMVQFVAKKYDRFPFLKKQLRSSWSFLATPHQSSETCRFYAMELWNFSPPPKQLLRKTCQPPTGSPTFATGYLWNLGHKVADGRKEAHTNASKQLMKYELVSDFPTLFCPVFTTIDHGKGKAKQKRRGEWRRVAGGTVNWISYPATETNGHTSSFWLCQHSFLHVNWLIVSVEREKKQEQTNWK